MKGKPQPTTNQGLLLYCGAEVEPSYASFSSYIGGAFALLAGGEDCLRRNGDCFRMAVLAAVRDRGPQDSGIEERSELSSLPYWQAGLGLFLGGGAARRR